MSRSREQDQSPGGLVPPLSSALRLMLLLAAVTPSLKACLVRHSVKGSSVACHPPAQPPSHFPADTLYLAVEFFNLTQLPADTLQNVSHLQELHLSSNRLEMLAAEFLLPVPQLQVLDLTGNALAGLPPGLFRVSRALHTLVLKGNRLRDLKAEWLSGLKALAYLDLSGNRLCTLPRRLLANFTGLLILNLSDNQLESLPDDLLQGPLRLDRLHLEGNRLRTLDKELLAPQTGLRYLFMQNNSLATVAAGAFEGLRELDMLDLSDNLLSSVPAGLWASLGRPARAMNEGFDISQNPWVCDENLDDLYHWLLANNNTMFSRKETLCAGPEALKGRLLLEVARGQMGRTPHLAKSPIF